MRIPKKIRVYKYHKINEHLFQMLSLNAFYCATFKELNDPLEGKINLNELFLNNLFQGCGKWQLDYPYILWDEFISQAESRLDLMFLLDTHKKRLKEEDLYKVEGSERTTIILSYPTLKEFFTFILMKAYNYRVVCFSRFKKDEKEKEKLMWSYYSGSAKGVRLTFDLPYPLITNFEELQPIIFEPVIYKTKPPRLETEKEFLECLRFKYEIWERENEYRILVRNLTGVGFLQKRLKEVTFGLNVEEKDIIGIIRLCKKLNYKCVYKMLIYNTDGELIEVIIPLEGVETYTKLRDKTEFRIEI